MIVWWRCSGNSIWKNSKVFEQNGDLLNFKVNIDPMAVLSQVKPGWAELSQAEPSWAKLSQAEKIWERFGQDKRELKGLIGKREKKKEEKKE